MILPEFLKKIVLISLFIYSVYSLLSTFISIHTNVIQKDNEYKEKILGLKTEKTNLEDKLKNINSDEFVEKEARTRLNMKKDGEEVYLISNNEPVKNPEVKYTETLGDNTPDQTNFQKWMEILF